MGDGHVQDATGTRPPVESLKSIVHNHSRPAGRGCGLGRGHAAADGWCIAVSDDVIDGEEDKGHDY
jgi:hypothetical protein